MASVSATTRRVTGIDVQRLPLAAFIGAITTVVINLLILFVAQSVFGLPLAVPMGGAGVPAEPLSAIPVIIASSVPAVGAAILLAILNRFIARPVLVFQIISILLLLLTFPYVLPVDLATKLTLSLMHIVAAVAITGSLLTVGREQ